MSTPTYGPGIEITGRITARVCGDPDAGGGGVRRQAAARVSAIAATKLLARRAQRQAELDAGKLPDFLPETRAIRDGDWTCAPYPADIADRRVEITGPVDRKMIVNALNSGASVFMADFEDANTPKWDNNLQGHLNLRDAIRRRIDFTSPEGKQYRLKREDRRAVRAAARLAPAREARADRRHADLAAASSISRSTSSTTRRSSLRARQRAVFLPAEARKPPRGAAVERRLRDGRSDELGVAQGTIKATVLIETLLAAFEMDEILYELREHSAGLNCGRWDYIFSCIKKFRNHHDFCLADRALVTMTTHFMKSYAELLVKTCHRRNIHAMGGMAAQIPIKNDEAANARGVREGEGRQGARGDLRPRRHVGRAPGPRAGREGSVRPADAGAEPDRDEEARRRPRDGRRPAPLGAGEADHREAACGSTSTSRSSTSARGSRGRARCRSST